MNFLAIDTETLSLKSNAAVDQIGLTFFDLNTELRCLDTAMEKGTAYQFDIYEECWKDISFFIVDQNTLDWRESEGTPIAKPAPGEGYTYNEAINQISLLIEARKPDLIYMQGKDFDISKIKGICEYLDMEEPWGKKYYILKCSRDLIHFTFSDQTNVADLTGKKNCHRAVDDTWNQAKAIQIALKRKQRMEAVYKPFSAIETFINRLTKKYGAIA